jgi:outer membrane protein OmpA-like peptidoglycan-associated protein
VADQQQKGASKDADREAVDQALRDTFDPLFTELTFAGIPEPTAERVLSLFLQTPWAVRDDRTVRRLIDTLWTPSSVARARVNRTLVRMQEADYKAHALPPELLAPPESGEALEDIDRRVRRWREWWTTLSAAPPPPPPPPAATPAETELETLGRHVVQVSFENNSAELKEDVPAALEELRMLLDEHPSWTLRIEGHTDDVGSDRANMDLSRRRAEAITMFLTERGVAAARLETRAYGEREPLVRETTPEARARNRRVELLRTDGEFARRAPR